MATSQLEVLNLASAIHEAGDPAGLFLREADDCVALTDLLGGSALYGRGDELQGRSVLLATKGQLTTACALAELDGVVRRVVLCPPDLPLEHLSHVMDLAEVDSIVSDRDVTRFSGPRSLYFSPCSRTITPASPVMPVGHKTEWVLLTSGTTGAPKLVIHTLASLTAGIRRGRSSGRPIVWSTFYDIRRYGGLQILLRALLTGTSLVLPGTGESTVDFLERAGSLGVTHISGTPSHWRRALMSPSIHGLKPEYVRLSGEAPDQTILNGLRETFPGARIVHAFASTEAGLAFEVDDAISGFPPPAMTSVPGVEIAIREGTLRIRSAGNACRYLGENAPVLKDADGWVNTSDLLEMRDGRYFFCGRRDGVINVGGLKVHPEEIESVISRHPEVQMCVVRGKKSRITGALVVADVVLRQSGAGEEGDIPSVQDDILQLCRESLAAHKVPAAIHIVPMLALSESGKVLRRDA
ncbi:MAG TPA: fatty acid--CoA ligase family protein [Acidobacteriaceae bacterium]|jgi:acyl-coenzyme A synthetase/AMP-(fatty) acid ligase|nr:fatty acid--CoA ligase family protein [Acidobacteriaceae bacterium]